LWLGTTSQASADDVTSTDPATTQATPSVTDDPSQATTDAQEPDATTDDETNKGTSSSTDQNPPSTSDETSTSDDNLDIPDPTEDEAGTADGDYSSMSIVGQTSDPTTSDKPVTIGDGIKEYQSADPMVAIALQPGMTAPSDWILTKTANVYYVAGDSADISINNGQDYTNIGNYDVTLSAAGLGRLQALNPTVNITANSVAIGDLTVAQTVLPNGTFIIKTTTKPYDNNASTDPTSYNVINRFTKLVVPDDWIKQADGSYQVPVGGDGIDASGITSQEIGSYQLKFTNEAIKKLYELNPNYVVHEGIVVPSYFQILNNYAAMIGSPTVRANEVVKLTVTMDKRYQVPTDWTVVYANGNTSVTYDVPFDEYVDTSSYGSAYANVYGL
ncbi:MAG: hypothetical protein MJ139_06675, partial [Limosilactobacillus sp.]|nr:hypothetical protein [Limosilactobacillus sp.]